METYAQKTKITFPSLRKSFSSPKWKKLMILAKIIHLISIFTPWIRRSLFILRFNPEIYSRTCFPIEEWFWSFMAVYPTCNGNNVLLLWNYWFNTQEPYYQGWLGVFIFQILTLTVAVATAVRKSGNKKRSVAATVLLSILPPILCFYQYLQLPYYADTAQFSVGFWLSIISPIMFFVSSNLLKRELPSANC